MKKWFRSISRKLFGWSIIMGQSGIAALDMLEGLESMNKTFKDKVDKGASGQTAV